MVAVALTTNAADYVKVEKNTSGNSITVPLPANARVGDVLVATFASDFNAGVTTATPGWTRISVPKAGTFREVAVFHAFTTNGLPEPLVLTQSTATNIRATAAMYRVTGASQTERTTGTAVTAATDQAVNTRSFSIPTTGAAGGLTVVVAYNNANSSQGATVAADVKFNGNTATSHLVSYGTGSAAASSSSTNSAVYFSATPGPFTVDWGKAIANSSGVAVTIPAADTVVTPEPEPVEPEHEDEPGVMIQIGPGNFTVGAVNQPGVAPSAFMSIPSRTRTGDVLIAAVTHSGNAAVAVDASWTLLSKVRTGSNRWLSAYGFPVRGNPPLSVTFSTTEVGARLDALIVRLTGVPLENYLKMAGEWQLTDAGANRTEYTIPATTDTTGMTLVLAYTNVSAGAAPALTTVANGKLVAHVNQTTDGVATTTLSVWRHHSGVRKDVTIAPAAANAAGFQLTFQGVQTEAPATWEAKVYSDGKVSSATVAAVHQGTSFVTPKQVSWEPRNYTIDDLFSTNPFFIAHRGSGDNWPEHTLESYVNSTAFGVKALELSVQLTADNVLICHHDLNFKKTAGDERTVRSMTYAEIQEQIKIDTRQWTGMSSTMKPPPTAKEAIDALIDTHVIFIEDKAGDGATALLNLMDTYPNGKEKFVWKQWAGANQWTAAKQRGYKLWGYFMADIFARIPELAPNFDYLGIPHTASDQVVSDIVAEGAKRNQPVIMWEVHYRNVFERAKKLGVQGMMTSNIPYVYTTPLAQFTEDQWHTGKRPAGDLPHSVDAGWVLQPQIDPADGGICRYIEKNAGALSMGSLCPVGMDSYAIEWEMRYPGPLPLEASHAGIYLGHDSDYTHRTSTSSVNGGYHVIQRGNGVFDLMRHDPGSSAGIPLATVTTTKPAVGTWMKFRVEVTPEVVTAKRLDVANPVTISVVDDLYRGGYFGLQKNYTTATSDPAQPCEYRSVKVIPM